MAYVWISREPDGILVDVNTDRRQNQDETDKHARSLGFKAVTKWKEYDDYGECLYAKGSKELKLANIRWKLNGPMPKERGR